MIFFSAFYISNESCINLKKKYNSLTNGLKTCINPTITFITSPEISSP